MAEDLSKLSDAELDARLAAKRAGGSSRAPVSAPTPDSPLVSAAKGIGGAVVRGALKAADFVDSYTGAPARAAVDAAFTAPMSPGARTPNIPAMADAFANQFGQPTENAPTGKEIASKRLGLSEKPLSEIAPGLYTSDPNDENFWRFQLKKGGIFDVSPAGAAGLAIDVGADPTNAIPGVVAAKNVAKGTRVGSAALKATEKLAAIPEKALARIAEAATGLPSEVIRNYAKRADDVEKVIRSSGGDIGQATLEFKNRLQADLRSTAQKYGREVGESIQAVPEFTTPNIQVDVILDSLEKSKGKMNPKYDKRAIELVDEIIDDIRGNVAEGHMSLYNLQQTKQFLQTKSAKAFKREGQIFNATEDQMKKVANAANNARFEARKLLDENGPPQLKEANAKLAELHRLEDNLDARPLMKQSSSASKVFTAGTKENSQGSAMLRRISKATGTDYNRQALDLATASRLANPKFVAQSGQGTTSTSRSLSLGGLGGMIGTAVMPGVGTAVGTGIGLALSSPAALKAAIRTGRFPIGLAERLGAGKGTLSDAGIASLYEALRTPTGQRAIEEYLAGEQ